MANNMRWRYGDTNPVMLPVDASTEVQIGDLVYQEAGAAKPASALVDQGSEALNQQTFQGAFVGVAMQASVSGDSGSIRIATSGVFEFDCVAIEHELGDLIGVAEDATGTAFEDQKVSTVLGIAEAIGRCAKRAELASPRVLVDIVSTVLKGGVQAAA